MSLLPALFDNKTPCFISFHPDKEYDGQWMEIQFPGNIPTIHLQDMAVHFTKTLNGFKLPLMETYCTEQEDGSWLIHPNPFMSFSLSLL